MTTGDEAVRIGGAVRSLLGGASQAELARRLGADPATVSRWVNGKAGLTHEDVAKIESALHLAPGTVAVVAGYYDHQASADLRTLLLTDSHLSPEDRELLARLYDRLRRD
jgi:transcriptional regulator with XRE-family HTH domain